MRDGRWLDHHGNGKLWLEATYDLGRVHGRYREWTRHGELRRELEYDDGKLVSQRRRASKASESR